MPLIKTDETTRAAFSDPAPYRGLLGFHKYWGKKPAEPISYLIQKLCAPNGIVCDPFIGYGTTAMVALSTKRRLIGIDLNPVAIRISRLITSPPDLVKVKQSLTTIGDLARNSINESYKTNQQETATHYVWRANEMLKVWAERQGGRIEFAPTPSDIALANKYEGYVPRRIRPLQLFSNSRINSSRTTGLQNLFRGRALRNIDLILDAIQRLPRDHQEPMFLSLTAAIGQMSKMVFAITGRGKMRGISTDRMEVGSWVIGYWKPVLHFEVNVWNCFHRRVRKLVNALSEQTAQLRNPTVGEISDVVSGLADFALITGDALKVMRELGDRSLDLIVTDPPHSDRIPYLELSELWNAVLGEQACFRDEIVVSNAKERRKTLDQYIEAMSRFMVLATNKLKEGGLLILFFNARSRASWEFLRKMSEHTATSALNYLGCFPLTYSASSVVQDNRSGALRADYGLAFSRTSTSPSALTTIPHWSSKLPAPGH